jgi:hypothetical protein
LNLSPYLAPPRGFVPAQDVRRAKILPGQPAFITRRRARGAKARGVAYERKAQRYLAECAIGKPRAEYISGPWIEFEDASGRRWCQPDGLFLDHEHSVCIIAEIKYRHCAEAWWQLWRLYLPVVRVLYRSYGYGCLEVVRYHDPQTPFPARYTFTPEATAIPQANLTAVHIWNPARA